uniref:Uncharacterized protein n=1 Tax=Steinernema glaseri TaxID=37863 RepID=A0A1I7YTS8_9BILA
MNDKTEPVTGKVIPVRSMSSAQLEAAPIESGQSLSAGFVEKKEPFMKSSQPQKAFVSPPEQRSFFTMASGINDITVKEQSTPSQHRGQQQVKRKVPASPSDNESTPDGARCRKVTCRRRLTFDDL